MSGSLAIHGAKNSVLPILAACLLAPGQSVIHNCPDLSDVSATLDILRLLGCRADRDGPTVTVDATALCRCNIPEHLMREMRSSVIFLGALLSRLGETELSYPGGCELGPRPIDLHLSALRLLGAEIWEEQGALCCRRGRNPRGRELCLSIPSVGATENAMLAACGCPGLTTVVGAAQEPEIVDLQNFLRAMGAEIWEEQGALCCRRGRNPRGRELCLSIPSVGATENAMLAACGCPGLTTVVGAAQEPEIVDLQNFLRAMGAKIDGAGTPTLTIEGGAPLHPAEYWVMGDRVAAATYLCGAAAAGGEVSITGVAPETLTAVLSCLEEAGCTLRTGPDQIVLASSAPLQGIPPVRTAPYPGFPTDAQAILMAALAGGEGATLFVENIFDSRYRHVD